MDEHLEASYEERYDPIREEKADDPDDDLETCSWCTTEVDDSSLKTTEDGARICPDCQHDLLDRFPDTRFDEDD